MAPKEEAKRIATYIPRWGIWLCLDLCSPPIRWFAHLTGGEGCCPRRFPTGSSNGNTWARLCRSRDDAVGLAACQKGLSVGFNTAAALVHELLEARDEKRLLRLQRQLAGYNLLIIDELGYVPLSQTGAELLFEVFSQRYERGSTVVTSNLPFDEWTSVFGSERLTGALLDRLTHHVHILQMNGDSYRLNQSRRRSHRASSDTPEDNPIQA